MPSSENDFYLASRRGFLEALQNDFHWKCLFTTLAVHICIVYVLWCHAKYLAYGTSFPNNIIGSGPCSHGYNFIPIGIGLIFYLLYLSECWHYQAQINTIPKRNIEQFGNYFEALRSVTPIVWWKSTCYHYARRTRQITRYRNGDAITAHQIYYERVNSSNTRNVFIHDFCGQKDISKKLPDLSKYPLVKIHLSKGFIFACIEAADEFESQRMQFFTENEQRDDYMEVREGLDLTNLPFEKKIFVFQKRKDSQLNGDTLGALFREPTSLSIPWFMLEMLFWIISIFLLSWPLRIYRGFKLVHVHIRITKLFGTNYLSPSSVNYTCTFNQGLTSTGIGNCFMVPSYSQAILLDRVPTSESSRGFGIIRNLLPVNRPPPRFESEYIHQPRYGNNNNYGSFALASHNNNRGSRILLRNNNNESMQSYQAKQMGRTHSYNHFRKPSSNSTTDNMEDSHISSRWNLPLFMNSNNNNIPNGEERVVPRRSNTISEGIDISPPARFSHPGVNDRAPLIDQSDHHGYSGDVITMNDGNEPPPTYEMAIRACRPIFHRIRQSLNSLSSLPSSSSRNFSQLEDINESIS